MEQRRSTQLCTSTQCSTSGNSLFDIADPTPGLLIAHAPKLGVGGDRCLIDASFTVGRGEDCSLAIRDTKLSTQHFRILCDGHECMIEDLDSTNGTFLMGLPVRNQMVLNDQDVIRAGRSVFVFHKDASPLVHAQYIKRYGMAGKFHTDVLLMQLFEAAASSRNVLLAGDTGTGKELAARALSAMLGEPEEPLKIYIYNAARFASREEAVSTLFGVVPRFFSGVDGRVGMIEQAHGGALFIDEIHNLPIENQRMLLRIMEDGKTARLGATKSRAVSVRFIIASNMGGKTRGLARDLFARLRLIQIPPLNERIADVPAIFNKLLRDNLAQQSVDVEDIRPLFKGDHYEALCLSDYGDKNIRSLVDLVDRITTRIAVGDTPEKTIARIFGEQFRDCPVVQRQKSNSGDIGRSIYEQNKLLILTIYRECDEDTSETLQRLKTSGLSCSRRWLSIYLEKWGAIKQ